MKFNIRNLAIVTFLIAAQIAAFTLKSKAQNEYVTGRSGNMTLVYVPHTDTLNFDEYLLGDETFLSYKKNEAIIQCDNEAIASKIIKVHEQLIKKYTCTWKTDRHGRYKHYSFFLNKEDAYIIKNWAKSNL